MALIAGVEIFVPFGSAISEAHALLGRLLLPVVIGCGCAAFNYINNYLDRDILNKNDEAWLAKNKQEYEKKIGIKKGKQLEISNSISKIEERKAKIEGQRKHYIGFLNEICEESGVLVSEEYRTNLIGSTNTSPILVK